MNGQGEKKNVLDKEERDIILLAKMGNKKAFSEIFSLYQKNSPDRSPAITKDLSSFVPFIAATASSKDLCGCILPEYKAKSSSSPVGENSE